jgi:ABC-type branched-subunit amino acid transport system substrate-binding protein
MLLCGLLGCTGGENRVATIGVNDHEIVLGQAAALTGPAQSLGREMQAGANAYFGHINAQGGIYGRKIRLITLDDGYEPDKTSVATQKLIDEDKVFLLFGYVGTPTSTVAVPMSEKAGVPFFAPFTGAEFLRNPVKPTVYNVRASYYQETEEHIHQLVDILRKKRIAVFYQDDSYGKAGLSGVLRAMEQRGLQISAEGTYTRNTTQVQAAINSIRPANPEAVVMIGAYKACAAFIKQAKAAGMTNTLFLNVSFVGSLPLAQELGEAGNGVIVTQVVPLPWDTSTPLVAEYQRHMQQYAPQAEFGFGSLEGYLDARVLVQALRDVGLSLTRERLIQTLDTMSYAHFGGVSIGFSPTDHQGLDTVYLTVIKDGKYKQLPSLDALTYDQS